MTSTRALIEACFLFFRSSLTADCFMGIKIHEITKSKKHEIITGVFVVSVLLCFCDG